jgi:hypothetical protein
MVTIDTSLRADQENENSKLATNPAAFDIVEDLMVRSVPLLKEFDQVYGGERPEITSEEARKSYPHSRCEQRLMSGLQASVRPTRESVISQWSFW